MSPRSMEPISPMNSHFAALAQREKQQQQQQQTLRSLSSRDLGSGTSLIVGSPVNSSWPNWGSPSRAPDWEVNSEELGRLQRSSSFELRSGGGEEPDLSWVHSLVKESPPEKPVGTGSAHASAGRSNLMPAGVIPGGEVPNSNLHMGGLDQAADVGALLEQMQLERKVV
uniref:Uncharacterized protein n=1 Tax=Ananas comosus var. bracteatus TaxID=296719 RepID=A0A6V7PNZ6_ANACO|nr:unnamed protein product [Ananas comosus var. bracteatus]